MDASIDGRRTHPRPGVTVPLTAPWWVRPGLEIEDGRLRIVACDAEALAREHGTPLFVIACGRWGARTSWTVDGSVG